MIVRNRYLLLVDFFLVPLAVVVSFMLRFDTSNVWEYLGQFRFLLPMLVLIRLPLFYAFGLYRRMWVYASVDELIAIGESVLLGSAVATVAILAGLALNFISFFPRSIILIEAMLTLLLVGGLRFSFRLSRHMQVSRRSNGLEQGVIDKRVLVFGAGDAGALVVHEMQTNPALGLMPVAFLDDDPHKQGLRIHNVPVLGDRSITDEVVRARHIDVAVIAMPIASGRIIRDITAVCHKCGIPVKTIPGIYEILDGSVKVSAIREVELEDLLRRDPVKIDLEQVGQYLGGARVLVTGAGGSIGSELCRQIARFGPQRLILFELAENSLYQIHRELCTRFPNLKTVPILGDIRESAKVDLVFAQQQPQIVFHAAAHKHVPLMESNVDEVVANNVFGTRNVLDASARYVVNRFVLISTDKAVNPKSVMGASKRVAELLVRDAARQKGRAFVAVRFGNVLGSSGSVVPLFKEQIAAGGPVTVTHPDVQRYFMTIPEAVSLIIQAAVMGQGGEIFVLDMGEPVKIVDLARDLIRLSGFEPGHDIEITFIGFRPGEKMSEQLFMANEQSLMTKHPQISVAQAEWDDGDKLRQNLVVLESFVEARDASKIKEKLKDIVPHYSPG